MGQRLNVEIMGEEEVLANCYYHWSGYTLSSIHITGEIIKYLVENKVTLDHKGAIEILTKATGATLNKEEWERGVVMGVLSGEYQDKADRNEGLIAISKEGIDETRYWEEGRITIYPDKETFSFACASEKDYIDDDKIWSRISDLFHVIEGIDSPYNIPFNKQIILGEGIKIAEESDVFKGRFCIGRRCYNSIY